MRQCPPTLTPTPTATLAPAPTRTSPPNQASRFAAAFQQTLETWEKALSHISETVEMIMGVQRKWMYLESIFVGSEDIRKQLPAESAMFDDVNANWKRTTKELFDAGTAYKGAHIPGILDRLGDMDDKLDRIQKSLDA